MKNKLLSFALLLLITAAPKILFSQNHKDISIKIVKSSLSELKGYDWLKELCEIGPRLSGSDNSLKAINWAKKKMEDCGFDKVWLQPVMVPKWERGKFEKGVISKSIKYLDKKLNITALGGSISTPSNGITAEVIEVSSMEEVSKLGNKAKGKIVFYNQKFDNSLLSTFGGYGKAVGVRFSGAVEAAKVGAVGSIIRSIQSNYDNNPHTGVMSYNDSITKIPSATIGLVDADFLSKALKEEPNLKITFQLDCKSYGLVQSYNVIGELKGSEKPNEVIVVGGHFDSWDKGCGAHDDGAPCIQTMEVLDLFKRLSIKPKRTVRCVLFINEENGNKGAIEYGKYALGSKEIHIAAIESDRGAFTPRGFNVTTDSVTLKKLQAWLPYLQYANIEWIRSGGSGADVSQIKNAKALFGYVPDDQRYMDVHHSDNDVLSAVHPREMELGSAAMAILTYLLSQEGL